MAPTSFYSRLAAYYETIFPFSAGVYAFLRQTIPACCRTCVDVGCGTGHYAARLADEGVTMVAVDSDAAMVAYARQHYSQLAVECVGMQSVATLPRLFDITAFDAAYCIGNTAAHIPQTELATFLLDLAHILRPGAVWIIQVMNWDYVLHQRAVTFPLITAENDVTFYREYRDISEERVTFHTRLQSGPTVIFEDAVTLYPLRAAEIIELHSQAGFTLQQHVGNYAGAAWDALMFSANIFVFTR